jgi:hypothetical protein
VEAPGDAREVVASPAVTQCDSDRKDLRPPPPGNPIDRADQISEEVVGVEFPDDQLHERTRPPEACRPLCKQLHCGKTELRPPPLGIELLCCSLGVLELSVGADGTVMMLAHSSSTSDGARNDRADQVRRAWAVRVTTVGVGEPGGDVPAWR